MSHRLPLAEREQAVLPATRIGARTSAFAVVAGGRESRSTTGCGQSLPKNAPLKQAGISPPQKVITGRDFVQVVKAPQLVGKPSPDNPKDSKGELEAFQTVLKAMRSVWCRAHHNQTLW